MAIGHTHWHTHILYTERVRERNKERLLKSWVHLKGIEIRATWGLVPASPRPWWEPLGVWADSGQCQSWAGARQASPLPTPEAFWCGCQGRWGDLGHTRRGQCLISPRSPSLSPFIWAGRCVHWSFFFLPLFFLFLSLPLSVVLFFSSFLQQNSLHCASICHQSCSPETLESKAFQPLSDMLAKHSAYPQW